MTKKPKCKTPRCENDGGGKLGLCSACRSALYRINKNGMSKARNWYGKLVFWKRRYEFFGVKEDK